MTWLARWRVPLGFAAGFFVLWLARPTPMSMLIGVAVALVGEALRIWAAGHIEKGREITTSGPYRFMRHPLYVGSTLLAVGFTIASARWEVAVLAAVYLATTMVAAVRTEEATLDARFDGQYAAYRAGQFDAGARRFDMARARRNGEHRTVAGVLIAVLVFYLRG